MIPDLATETQRHMKTRIETGKIVKAAREEQGLRPVDLARKTGVSLPAISSIEGGYGNSIPALEAVCEALGLVLEDQA